MSILSRMSGTALITGIAGPDGSHLAELLLHQGYRVVGRLGVRVRLAIDEGEAQGG